jgi:CRISPR system Cascade subunit CasB
MSDAKGRGEAAAAWWRRALADRDSGAARGLAARLRRASAIEALAEPEVQRLAREVRIGPAEAGLLARLVQALAELREGDARPLAARLGGAEPVLSPLRFQRLIRARGEEFDAALRRAIVMADRRCNVARLAADLLAWDDPDRGDQARAVWCFDYFGGVPATSPVPSEETAE